MTVFGNSEQWLDLLESLVPDIVSLILDAWVTMPTIEPDAKEDPVSEELCRKLRAMRTLSELPLQVQTQLVELESAGDADQGRIDIVFVPLVPDEAIYFALECKRINVLQANGKVRRYFAEYVTQGLTRFVTGQYSYAVRHGGMLAFVLDGDLESATEGILNNILANREILGMDRTEIQNSRFAPDDPRLRETIHARTVAAGNVLVQHFFMPAAVPTTE
ncbi:MAG: hypothetical protein AAFN77_18300 [Planctomycetota bacterium]